MDNLDHLRNFNELFNKINKLTAPYESFKISTFKDPIFEAISLAAINDKIPNISFDYNYLDTYNKSYKNIFDEFDKTLFPPAVFETINKLHDLNRWSDFAKISILQNLEIAIENDNFEEVLSDVNDNIDTINSNVEEFDKNLVYHINNFLNFFTNYLKENPISNLSFYVFQTLLFAYIGNVLFSNSEPVINNNIVVNQAIRIETIAKVNTDCLDLRNFARNDSKVVGSLTKDTEVEILKDSIKWTFIIEKSTTQTGWVRKEYLNYVQ